MASSSPLEIQHVSYLELKYIEILNKNGITEKVSEIIVKDPELQGDGLVSQPLYITVKFENPKLAQLHLFAKTETTSASHVEVIRELKAFEKEARFFLEYVPAAEELCKKYGQEELMSIYPKCYYADDNLVVLENLVLDEGYSLQNKEDMHKLKEAKAALLALAKHHAISFCLVKEYKGGENFLKKFKDFDFGGFSKPQCRKMMEPMIVNGVNNNMKILENYSVPGGDLALERLKHEEKRVYEIVLKPLDYSPGEDTFFVLNHGDFWSNNVMYLRDEETQEISKVKMIDFQMVRYNSAAIDLGYFMYTSVKPEVRRQHLNLLLEFYLDHLKKACEDLGHPMNLSFEELLLEFRKKFQHGFWVGFSITCGPGIGIFSEVNVNEMKDTSEFGLYFSKAIQKWTDDNPEKCEEVAKDIVGFIEEYYQLRMD